MTMQLKIKKLHPDAVIPAYATPGAACFDIRVFAPMARSSLMQHCSATFQTGLAFEVPDGHVMLVFSRSGHGFNSGVRLANCVGVIDSDYRGELAVRLTTDDQRTLLLGHGDRIAQALVIPVPRVEFVEVDELNETARGTGGFGSSGR